MRGEQYNPANPQEHLTRMLQDWYYAPKGPESGGPGVWKELHPEIVRVKLDEDWYDCETATGHVLTLDDDGKPQPQWKVNLRDPLGIKTGSPLYDVLEGYMPGGVCFWAIATQDGPSPDTDDGDDTSQGPFYEPLPFGICCNEQSSSSPSSSSPSSSSPSSSSPSSSSPSSSSPSSSSPSSSSPSSSSPSHSPSHSPSGSSSSKSTAIVPASWSPTGYAALYVAEMPDVRFDDVMPVSLPVKGEDGPEYCGFFPIDPHFVEVTEPGTLEVCGTAADNAVAVGASVFGGTVRVCIPAGSPKTRVVIRLTGIRKGFANQRFAARTEAQFQSNERFIRSAYEQ